MKKVYVWTEEPILGKVPVHWQEDGRQYSTYYPQYRHEVEARIAHLREAYAGWEVVLRKHPLAR